MNFPQFGPPLLLALDLDGTLVEDGQNDVPERTIAALAELRKLGTVRLAVITGRDQVHPQVMEAVQPDAVVKNNGGRVEVGATLCSNATFSQDDVRAALNHGLENPRIALFTDTGLYYDLPEGLEPIGWMIGRPYQEMAFAPREGVVKLGYFHPNVGSFASRLRESHPHLVVTGGHAPNFDYLSVTPAGAHKGAGLEKVALALDIPLSHTVVCGDSDNDLTMFELAEFAVQSGTLELLSHAADAQVSGPVALGEYLWEWAKQLH